MKDHNIETASNETLKEDYLSFLKVLGRGREEQDVDLMVSSMEELDRIEGELRSRNDWPWGD